VTRYRTHGIFVTAERLLRKAEGLYEARRSVERAVGE
jgi:hypothetical protein